MKDKPNEKLKECGGTRYTLGPNSSIHNIRVLPKDEKVMASTKVRCVAVGNKTYDTLVDENTYLVYRKHEQTGEPTYSLCIYRNGCWIPYGIDNFIKNMSGFVGIPVMDDDYWICANEAFDNFETETVESVANNESEKSNSDNVKNETVQDFVKRRLMEIEMEEDENIRKVREEERERAWKGEFESISIPVSPTKNDYALKRTNQIINILMEYIQKMKDDIIDEPIIEQNWHHLKEIINELFDRIAKLESKVNELQLLPSHPLQPYTPVSPYIQDHPWPLGPVITYAIPGKGTVTSTIINE